MNQEVREDEGKDGGMKRNDWRGVTKHHADVADSLPQPFLPPSLPTSKPA